MRPRTIWPVLFGAFFLVGVFFLLEEHSAQVLGALPYLLGIAAMLFCMLGHRHAGARRTRDHQHGDAR